MSMVIDKNTDKNDELDTGWEYALHGAEREILKAQKRLKQLRNSVRIIKKKLKDGEPWPGAQSSGQSQEGATQ